MSSDDAVGRWLEQAGRVPMLTVAEEVHLGQAIRAWLDDPEPSPAVVRRGRRARDRMVGANLRLVASVAKKYSIAATSRRLGLEDLLQEGTLGLQRGAEKFDPARGYKFSTYAYWWIRQSITRAMSSGGTIRLPINLHDDLARMTPQTLDEVDAGHRERLLAGMAARRIGSLDQRAGDDSSERSTIGDLVASEGPDQWTRLVAEEEWAKVASQLTDQELATVELVAGSGSREAGLALGVHAATVTARMRRIKARFNVA